MKINLTPPIMGHDDYPDIHITLSELKKAKTDREEFVSLVKLHEMIGASTGADTFFTENILDNLIKQCGGKGELVIAIDCNYPERHNKEYYIEYYVISDNVPRLLEVIIDE